MAFKTLEEAQKAYEAMAKTVEKLEADKKEADTKVSALEEETKKYKEDKDKAEKEAGEIKKMNFQLLNRISLGGGSQKSIEEKLAEGFGWKK